MTRDELLIFNAFAWLQENVENEDARAEIAGFLSAMEHRPDARKTFADLMIESTDKGEQLTFTVFGGLN